MKEIKDFFAAMNAWEIVGLFMAIGLIWLLVKIVVWIFSLFIIG